MIDFPNTYADIAVPDGAVVRSGGTDLQQRLRSANAQPHIVDLTGIDGFAGIESSAAGTRIGGGTRMAVVARELLATYPALAITTGGLATPQVRSQGTIGGNLTQHTRCWYYRHPEIDCFKSGGDSCPAREGRHLYGVAFDNSDCVHPHPSSIAMALLCYDTEIELADGRRGSTQQLLGDGVDPTRDNTLEPGEVIAAIHIDAPWEGEHGAYFRSISRFEAEWPLVECVVRASVVDGVIAQVALALGGVATVPIRMERVEEQLVGSSLDDATIAAVAASCTEGANPLPETGYKIDLIAATVIETLERLRESIRR